MKRALGVVLFEKSFPSPLRRSFLSLRTSFWQRAMSSAATSQSATAATSAVTNNGSVKVIREGRGEVVYPAEGNPVLQPGAVRQQGSERAGTQRVC